MNKKSIERLTHIVSDENFFNLDSGVVYLGVDPTAPGIHIGHLLPMQLAKELQNMGFKIILLVGGFTAQIGDPTGKSKTREELSNETAINNSLGIIDDYKNWFKNDITIVNNKDWLNMNLLDYMNLIRNTSINKQVKMETFANRLNNNLHLSGTEFMYPNLQFIDFLHLHNNYDCNIQIGGQDQWGNISYGVDMLKKFTKKDVYGICTPLLTNNGKKISKSENAVYIREAYPFYQFCLNLSDELVNKICYLLINKENGTVNDLCKYVLDTYFYNGKFDEILNYHHKLNNCTIDNCDENMKITRESMKLSKLIASLNWMSTTEAKQKIKEKAVYVNNKLSEDVIIDQSCKVQFGKKYIQFIHIIKNEI
jgi:tyrosyl-tRNA synthetase